MPKRSKSKPYSQMLNAISPFADIGISKKDDFTPGEKAKISRYFNEIARLRSRPVYIYRPRKKDRLAKAQRYSGHDKGFPGIKVAFIPTPDERPRISFRANGDLHVKTKYVDTVHIPIPFEALLKSPTAITRAIDKYPHINSFTIRAGLHEIAEGHTRATVSNAIQRLMTKYANEDANNYFGNWFNGLSGHTFKNQASIGDFLKAKEAAKREAKKQRNRKRK